MLSKARETGSMQAAPSTSPLLRFRLCRIAASFTAQMVIASLLLNPSANLAQEAAPPTQPQYYAVIIGVSEFEHLPKSEWLEYADDDAQAFYDFVTSPRGRAFPPENVFLMTNAEAQQAAMRSRLGSTLAKKIKPEDTVYIFIASHGMVEKEAAREGYLLASDSDREDLYSSALPMRELANIMQNRLKNAKRIFLFADVCRAGKLGQVQGNVNRYIEDASSKGEMMGLLASRPNEFSRESDQWGGGHGVFSYHLLKGLTGAADADKDETVTAAEIVSYLQTSVEDATERQQHIRDFGNFEPETPLSFVDKPAPKDWKIEATRKPRYATLGQLAAAQVPGQLPGVPISPADELRYQFAQSIREGRLLAPAGNNAIELHQRYTALPVTEDERDEADENLVIALASAADKVLWAYRRGDQVIKLDAAKYEEGARLYAKASEIAGDDIQLEAKAKFMAGRALVENRQFTTGITTLQQAISLDPDAAFAYNALGIAHMEQQRWNDAISHFKTASEKAEKWVYPHYNLARVYAGLQRYREAEEEFRAGIQLGQELGLKYSYLHYNLGVMYLFQGRLPQAEEQFRLTADMNPSDAMAFHNLGLIAEQRNNQRDAEASFRKAADLNSRLIEPRMKLAELYRRQKENTKLQAVLEEAVHSAPPVAGPYETLGRLLLEAKKLEEAEMVYMQMLGNGVEPAVALTGLGDVHAAQGNRAQAADDYRQAISRTTDRRAAGEIERKLRNVERGQ